MKKGQSGHHRQHLFERRLVPPLDLEMRGAFRDLPQSTEAEHIC